MTPYEISLTIFVLFVHFLADFVFQSDRVARAKSKSWGALFEHILLYTGTIFMAITFWGLPACSWQRDLFDGWIPYSAKWALVNGAAHFATDAITSRINARLWAQGRVHAFFVGVGADQFIHASTLILTLWAVRL